MGRHVPRLKGDRDIADLAERGVLLRNKGNGKRISYRFNWPPEVETYLTAEQEPEDEEQDQDAAPAP